jgi:hypothetical protein
MLQSLDTLDNGAQDHRNKGHDDYVVSACLCDADTVHRPSHWVGKGISAMHQSVEGDAMILSLDHGDAMVLWCPCRTVLAL